jgi:hypothetical protein
VELKPRLWRKLMHFGSSKKVGIERKCISLYSKYQRTKPALQKRSYAKAEFLANDLVGSDLLTSKESLTLF